MRALLSRAPGGPETLELDELPDPVPGPGELLVDVAACGINYPEVLIIEDKYQVKPPRPFAPGGEVSGTVAAVGEGVDGWQVGDRLLAVTGFGGLVEKLLVPARTAVRLPAHRDMTEGAGLLLTYLTAAHALADRGQLKAGETLLVLGAAGGTGIAAIEIGKALGARVVAAVSDESKAAAAREAGADETLLYGRAPFDKEASRALADRLKAAVGRDGAHVVFDPVGGDYCEPALRAIAWEGRYLVIGFPAGIPRLPLNLTLLKSCDVRGVFWGAYAARDPAGNAAHATQLLRWWDEGRIRPRIDKVFPFERGGAAIAHLAARKAIGKVVVQVTPAG